MAKNETKVQDLKKLTKTELAKLKKENDGVDVFEVIVTDGEKKRYAYLKDRSDDIPFVTAALELKGLKRALFCLDNLWILGDSKFQEENRVRIAGALQASNVIDVLESEVVKH